MHKKYKEPCMPICVDYIPENLELCSRCLFCEICPYDYTCNTFDRMVEYEDMVNDNTNQRVDKA